MDWLPDKYIISEELERTKESRSEGHNNGKK